MHAMDRPVDEQDEGFSSNEGRIARRNHTNRRRRVPAGDGRHPRAKGGFKVPNGDLV